MQTKQPSQTARGAAGHRAAHQIVEGGAIFKDPFARRILGAADCATADAHAADPATRSLRLFIAARSRFAEDSLAAAVARGIRQAVVLGAGFDTFGLRNPHVGLRVFEVDYPETQAWKRDRLAAEHITVPPSLTFVPIDFEIQGLADALVPSGFEIARPAFYLWLGVVPYLSRTAIDTVLEFIARQPGAEVVFDYSEPLENFPLERRAGAEALRERVASIGEPILSVFDPAELAALLRSHGFTLIDDLDRSTIAARFMPESANDPAGGIHLMRAGCPAS